jgi:hypothetical protein
MWDCPECGCHNIAADLEFCPQCLKPRAVVPAAVEEPPAETEATAAGDTDPGRTTAKGGRSRGKGDSV